MTNEVAENHKADYNESYVNISSIFNDLNIDIELARRAL